MSLATGAVYVVFLQIGDVVLVHDESGLYEQDLDGRLGFVNPLGLDVRTRTGQFLGKVRTNSSQAWTSKDARVLSWRGASSGCRMCNQVCTSASNA